MNISRGFLVTGALYLLVGVGLGTYMGGSGDHSLMGVHAHINLLGFALMAIFGLIYHAFPAMAASILGRVHFWLHQVATLLFLILLWALLSGSVEESSIGMPLGLTTVAIVIATAAFAWNVFRNAR